MYWGYTSGSGFGRSCSWYGGQTAGSLVGTWSLAWNATNDAKMLWPGGSYTYTATPTKPSAVNIAVGGLNGSTGSSQVDWIRVRKYAATDPTFSLGTEVVNYNMDGISVLDYYTGNVKTSFCGGELATFNSRYFFQLGAGGALYVELSDGSGSFSSPTTLAAYTNQPYYWFNSSSPFAWYNFAMPNNLPYGTGYRLRWRMVDRAYNGVPTPAFTLGAMPTSTNYTINDADQCDEDDKFTFTASGSIATGNTLAHSWTFASILLYYSIETFYFGPFSVLIRRCRLVLGSIETPHSSSHTRFAL